MTGGGCHLPRGGEMWTLCSRPLFPKQSRFSCWKTASGRGLTDLKSPSLYWSLGCFVPGKEGPAVWSFGSPPVPGPHAPRPGVAFPVHRPGDRRVGALFLSPQTLAGARAERGSRQSGVQPEGVRSRPNVRRCRDAQRLHKTAEGF